MIIDFMMHIRSILGIGVLLTLLFIAVGYGDDGDIRPGIIFAIYDK